MLKKTTALCLTILLTLAAVLPAYADVPGDDLSEGAPATQETDGTEDLTGGEDPSASGGELPDAGDPALGDEGDTAPESGTDDPVSSEADAVEETDDGAVSDEELPDEEASFSEDALDLTDPAPDEVLIEEDASEEEDEVLVEEDAASPLNELALSKIKAGYYKIGSINKGLSLDVSGGSLTDGANIQVHRPNGTMAQIFYISSNGDGTFAIQAAGSDKVLDVKKSGTAVGTNVQLWTKKDKHRAQTWKIYNDGGYLRFVNPNSGKALTVSGTNVCIGDNVGNMNTRWLVSKVDLDLRNFTVADLTKIYNYTGKPIEPYGDIKVTTSLKSDIARSESHPDYYITGGLDIPQFSLTNYGTPCGVTACAMVVSYLRGVITTPREIQNLWPQYSYNLHYLTNAAASYYGLGSVYTNGPQNAHETADINKAIAALKNGQAVISYQEGLSIFSMTGNSHFIVLRGVTPDGMIMVNDPNGTYPFYSHDSTTYEYTLFTPAQVAAHSREFYIFSKKSQAAPHTYTRTITPAAGTDYSVTFSDNIEPGVAKAVIKGINGLTGSVTKKFAIVDRNERIESGRAYTLASALAPLKTLDVAGGSTEKRANVQLYKRNGTPAQEWFFVQNDDGTWTIKNVKSGLVLDAQGGNTEDRTNIWQYKQNGTDAQKWRIEYGNDGSAQFFNVGAGKCIDIAGGVAADRTNIQIYHRQNTPKKLLSQQFYPVLCETEPCLDGRWTIRSAADSELVIAPKGDKTAKRTPLIINHENETQSAVFEFLYCGPGLYKITNVRSGLVLDVQGGVFENKRAIQLYKSNNTAAQRFTVNYQSDGSVTFGTALGQGKVIDISGGIIEPDTPLWLYKAQTKPEKMTAQTFILEPASQETESDESSQS